MAPKRKPTGLADGVGDIELLENPQKRFQAQIPPVLQGPNPAMKICSEPTGDDDDAIVISPVTWNRESKENSLIVEYDRQEWRVAWSATAQRPKTLRDEGIKITRLESSHQRSWLLERSRVIAYGTSSHVRRTFVPHANYPIFKLANHDDPQAREAIKREHEILRHLLKTKPNLPVVRIHTDPPLRDQKGIFGFQMEELFKIEVAQIPKYCGEIEDILKQLHQAGYVHGDVGIGNFMLDWRGKVKLIDFGEGGGIGEQTSEHHRCHFMEWMHGMTPRQVYNPTFEPGIDWLGFWRMKQSLDWNTESKIKRYFEKYGF